MPSTTNGAPQKTKRSAGGAGDAAKNAVDEFCQMLRTMAESEGLEEIQSMRQHNLSLEEELASTKTAYLTNIETLTDSMSKCKAQQELLTKADEEKQDYEKKLNDEKTAAKAKADAIEQQESQLQGLIDELKKKDTQIHLLQDVESERDAFKDQLDSKEQELGKITNELGLARGSLETIQSFMVSLEVLDDKTTQV
jgi:DNA repair exonuclease SbcCD ATPase subunit